jgi:hypothetical protein
MFLARQLRKYNYNESFIWNSSSFLCDYHLRNVTNKTNRQTEECGVEVDVFTSGQRDADHTTTKHRQVGMLLALGMMMQRDEERSQVRSLPAFAVKK